MEGYVYKGTCGALIEESWHGDTQFLQCSYGRGMYCDGGCYAEELCEECSVSPYTNTENNWQR